LSRGSTSTVSFAEQRRHTKKLRSLEQKVGLFWESPSKSGLLAFAVYSVFSLIHGSPIPASSLAYYNYLADAFNHGQLNLRIVPANVLDLSFFQGKYFLYWSPFPAVLLMPFVAVFGEGFSDVVFTLVVGGINVALVAWLLRIATARRVIRLSRVRRGTLVLFFALGTVHLTLSPFGRIWFTGQLVGFGCLAIAYLVSIGSRGYRGFIYTGLAISAALLTRNHLIFAGLWPAVYLLRQHRAESLRRKLALCVAGITPIALAVLMLAVYNFLRFGNMLDNGIPHHLMHPAFVADYQQYGAFNLHYVPINFFYQYLAYPLPLRPTSSLGGSLFLLSPVFFAVFWAFGGNRKWTAVVLLSTIALIATPILLLMGTGWVQFGPRYTLDFTVPLLLLTAMGIQKWSSRIVLLLTVVSMAHYCFGTLVLAHILSK